LLSKLVIDVTTESLPWPNFELASRVVFFFTERAQREINSLQKNVAAAVILTPCDAPELGEKHTRGFQAVLGADGTGEGRNFGHAWGPKFTPDAILGLKPPDSGRYEPGRRWVRGKNGEANGAPGRPGRGSESSRVRWLWRGYGGSSLSLPFVPFLPSFPHSRLLSCLRFRFLFLLICGWEALRSSSSHPNIAHPIHYPTPTVHLRMTAAPSGCTDVDWMDGWTQVSSHLASNPQYVCHIMHNIWVSQKSNTPGSNSKVVGPGWGNSSIACGFLNTVKVKSMWMDGWKETVWMYICWLHGWTEVSPTNLLPI
jgi:hypothetical protein